MSTFGSVRLADPGGEVVQLRQRGGGSQTHGGLNRNQRAACASFFCLLIQAREQNVLHLDANDALKVCAVITASALHTAMLMIFFSTRYLQHPSIQYVFFTILHTADRKRLQLAG